MLYGKIFFNCTQTTFFSCITFSFCIFLWLFVINLNKLQNSCENELFFCTNTLLSWQEGLHFLDTSQIKIKLNMNKNICFRAIAHVTENKLQHSAFYSCNNGHFLSCFTSKICWWICFLLYIPVSKEKMVYFKLFNWLFLSQVL